jgi:hypothetical protein
MGLGIGDLANFLKGRLRAMASSIVLEARGAPRRIAFTGDVGAEAFATMHHSVSPRSHGV